MGGERNEEARWPGDLRLAVCALVAWLWLWLRVDPSGMYHGSGLTLLPTYSVDPVSRAGQLALIGGPLGYASAWLAQWFVWPAAGAGLLTLCALAAALAADRAATCLAGKRVPGVRYVPWLMFLLADGQYLYLLDWQAGWAVALGAAATYLSWSQPRPAVRALVGLAALAALYRLLGGAALVAVPLAAVGETRWRGRRWVSVTAVVAGLAMPWVACRLGFDQAPAQAYRNLLPLAAFNDQFGIARAIGLGMLAFGVLAGALAVSTATQARRAPRPAVAWAGVSAMLLLVLVGFRDGSQAVSLDLCRRAADGDWAGLLASSQRLEPLTRTCWEDANILLALAHTGQVGDQLLARGVRTLAFLRDAPVFGDQVAVTRMRGQGGLQLRDLMLDLGLVNHAEHDNEEALETQGIYAPVAVSMARIQVLQGRPETARVLLRLAAAQPGDPAGAGRLLHALRGDPSLAGDPAQVALSQNRLHTDLYRAAQLLPVLEQATIEHPENRLAWEYLMAACLLFNEVPRLVAALPRMTAYGRTALPRHCEEAVLCHELLTGRPAELGRWSVRPEARARFAAFGQALGGADSVADALWQPNHPKPNAARVWQGAWTDTYYYYRLFGMSGAVR
ncbi:MAG: hypothetical protein HZB16_23380 [Armatimonadetes bacterium]|nr:hypothetical protein [Armatimonadota bacterium]